MRTGSAGEPPIQARAGAASRAAGERRGADRRPGAPAPVPPSRAHAHSAGPAGTAGVKAPPRAAPRSPANTERPTRPGETPASVRGRRARTAVANVRLRGRIALVVLLAMLAVALVRLIGIQAIDTAGYGAMSEQQRTREIPLLAQRGMIQDRNGVPLAFSVEGRAIAARPARFTTDAQRRMVAAILVDDARGGLTVDDVMAKLTSGKTYVYLARNLMPAQADAIMKKIGPMFDQQHQNAVVTERQDLRQYPDGSASAALVGGTDYDGNGLSGIEAKFNTKLSGKSGGRVVDVDAGGMIIPGSARDQVDATDGTDITLTIDSDLQYTALNMLTKRVDNSQAKSGCVVVMTVADAQIPAMACYQPGQSTRETGNRAVTDSIEPGSVNKVITFAAALQKGIITPTTVQRVDGQINEGDVIVHDAWVHGPVDMTATGILAKSSNVGTLMIAKKVGPDAFLDEAEKFGQGVRTGIQLPAESSGQLPAQSTWSASTFGNLPIGQGVSITLLQLAGMYQAIANGGVRVAPTVVANTTIDGQTVATPAGATTQVMSKANARTLLDMLRATTQDGDMNHHGTAPAAAITGYQVAAKTGTAQKVDPNTNEYSQTQITSTFAGIVPADNPKYVIAIMLDDPKGNSPAGTTSCAPLFHDIAAYAMRAADVPPSPTAAPIYDLYVNQGG